jgi:hypothetical protein
MALDAENSAYPLQRLSRKGEGGVWAMRKVDVDVDAFCQDVEEPFSLEYLTVCGMYNIYMVINSIGFAADLRWSVLNGWMEHD